jgi:hypothetical protein
MTRTSAFSVSRTLIAAAAIALCVAGGGASDGPSVFAEDLPNDPHNWCPIGGMDAQGDIVGYKQFQDVEIYRHSGNKKSKGNVVRIRDVSEGGIADIAGFQIGDLIYMVNGQPFKYRRDEIKALGLAIEDAETKGGTVRVTVVREVTTDKGELRFELVELKPSFPALGGYGKTTIFDCDKVEVVRKRALAEVVKLQDATSGMFPSTLGGNNGHVVMSSLCGLAMLGAIQGDRVVQAVSGETPDPDKKNDPNDPRGPYWREIEKAVEYVVATCGDEGPKWGQKPGGPN